MAEIEKLSALKVARATRPGRLADGGNLYLQVTSATVKSWIFRFQLNGRSREMGLGALSTLSLAEAREKARECRKLLLDGVDPIEAREAKRTQARHEAAGSITFRECAEAYVTAHATGWSNEEHRRQWRSTLATFAYPVFGDLPVAAIDTGLVMRCLEPLWSTRAVTAGRLRGRIEAVLDWATVRGYRRQGVNPAAWRGHLSHLLPPLSKVRTVEHHPALPYSEIGAFMAELRKQGGAPARALELTILTAGRAGEIVGARWGEINFNEALWTIPASRMKGRRPHRIPLSEPAMAVIEHMRKIGSSNEFVFPGRRAGKPLGNDGLFVLLRRMGRDDLTAHGFRSTFRDWAAEQTAFPSEVVEMALAHAVGNKVEAAYRRGDLFEKRRRLMDEWARYCASPVKAGKVVPIQRAKA
jgi:integrase